MKRKLIAASAALVGALSVALLVSSEPAMASRDGASRAALANMGARRPARDVARGRPSGARAPGAVAAVEPAAPAATLRPTASAAREAAATPAPDLEATIAREVATVAASLGLDDGTRTRVIELTRRSFAELMAELDPVARESSRPDVDDVIASRTRELHARILELLTPAQQGRYRELAGLPE